jgi:hypothetical protein
MSNGSEVSDLLEPYDAKVSRTVLRGGEGGNASPLPDQLDLFGEVVRAEKFSKVYQAVDHMRERYGKHTVFLGSSLLAQQFAQHLEDRGDEPNRRKPLFRGETKRQRLGIPTLMGKLIE